MRKLLTFHGILFHEQSIQPIAETGKLEFFRDSGVEDSSSVVDVHEAEIIRWLLGHPEARRLLYSQASLDPISGDWFSVGRPLIEKANAKPGDVDWLCVSAKQPHLAVAFECKRVKVRTDERGDDRVNKIEELGRGVAQASGLADMGFHRSFFMVIVQSDGRTRRDMSQVFRGATAGTFSIIYDFPQRESLNDDVGVVFVEIVQPTGRAIGEMAYVGVCVDRPARPREQSARLTSRVRECIRARG